MKFLLNLKILEVRVPPDIYDMMKVSGEVMYEPINDKMVWNNYKVVCDAKAKDVTFKYDHSIAEEYDE